MFYQLKCSAKFYALEANNNNFLLTTTYPKLFSNPNDENREKYLK